MPRAPISGVDVTFEAANGHDDLLLYESMPGLAAAVTVLSRRAGIDAAAVTYTHHRAHETTLHLVFGLVL
jgi:hypothetical protein